MSFLYDRLPEYTRYVVDNRTDTNVYGEEVKLLEQYLTIIDEEIFDFYKDQIYKMQYFSDIDLIDNDYLSYLAYLLGYIWDNKKTYQKQRDYLKNIVEFYKRKGTIFSIHYSLSLEDKDVEIIETYPWIFTLNKSKLNSDHRLPSRYYWSRGIFVVRTKLDLDKARDIVEENRPAGTLPIYEMYNASLDIPNGLEYTLDETDESAILYYQLIKKHNRPEYDAYYFFDLLKKKNTQPYYDKYFNIMRKSYDFYEPELYDQKWPKSLIVNITSDYDYTAYYFDYFQFADYELNFYDNLAYEDFSGYFIIHDHAKDYERDPVQYFNNGINLVSSRKSGSNSGTEFEIGGHHYLGQTLYVNSQWRLEQIYSHNLDKNNDDYEVIDFKTDQGKTDFSLNILNGDRAHHDQGFDKNYLQRLEVMWSSKWGLVTDWNECKLGKRYLLGNRSPFTASSGSIAPNPNPGSSGNNANDTQFLVSNYAYSWSDVSNTFEGKLNNLGVLPKTYVYNGNTYTFNEQNDEDYIYELIDGDTKVITYNKLKSFDKWTFERFDSFNNSFYPSVKFENHDNAVNLVEPLMHKNIEKILTASDLLGITIDVSFDIMNSDNRNVVIKINDVVLNNSEYYFERNVTELTKTDVKFIHSQNINDKLNVIIEDSTIITSGPILFTTNEDNIIKINQENIRIEKNPAIQDFNFIEFTNLKTLNKTKVNPNKMMVSNESFITDEFIIEGYKCKIYAYIDRGFIYSINVWFDGKFAKNAIDNDKTDTLMEVEQILPYGLKVKLVEYDLEFTISSRNNFKTNIIERNVSILGYKLPQIPEKHVNCKIFRLNHQLIKDRMLYMYRNLLDTIIEKI